MDQTITLPWYVIAVYTGVFFSWMLYLAYQEKVNTKDIALLKQSFQDIDDDLKSIREMFDERFDKNDHRMERMEDKIEKIYDLLHSRR